MNNKNIYIVQGLTFIDDSNFLDFFYEDSKGAIMTDFVLKHIVGGVSASGSFVVGKTKYHIHTKPRKTLKVIKDDSSTKVHGKIKEEFLFKAEGKIINPKTYIPIRLKTGIPEIDAVINSGGMSSDTFCKKPTDTAYTSPHITTEYTHPLRHFEHALAASITNKGKSLSDTVAKEFGKHLTKNFLNKGGN